MSKCYWKHWTLTLVSPLQLSTPVTLSAALANVQPCSKLIQLKAVLFPSVMYVKSNKCLNKAWFLLRNQFLHVNHESSCLSINGLFILYTSKNHKLFSYGLSFSQILFTSLSIWYSAHNKTSANFFNSKIKYLLHFWSRLNNRKPHINH